uniref:PHD-type domain-containing protein n=1 Tax=Parascaris equorum TaxID=6256 RepID=A0A914RWT8_PAREQ
MVHPNLSHLFYPHPTGKKVFLAQEKLIKECFQYITAAVDGIPRAVTDTLTLMLRRKEVGDSKWQRRAAEITIKALFLSRIEAITVLAYEDMLSRSEEHNSVDYVTPLSSPRKQRSKTSVNNNRRQESRTAGRNGDLTVEHSPTRYSLNDDDIVTSREHSDFDVIHERSPTDAGRYFLRGDRPSELYRTDLIRHLKKEEYQDSSSDDETPPMRLTDRWREEWNHVQHKIVVDPRFAKPCEGQTEKLRNFVQQLMSISSEKLIAVHDAPYVDDRFERVQMPPLISYHSAINRTAIHHDLLAPLASPTPFQADVPIYLNTDYEENDEIIFCDGCNVGVHQSCYGLDSVPHDEWLCYACTLLGYRVANYRGAMKCMKGGKTWAHIVCALWIPEVRFGDVDHRIELHHPKETLCFYVGVGQFMNHTGVQFAIRSRERVSIFLKKATDLSFLKDNCEASLVMKIEHDSSVDDGVRMVSLCEKHSQETHGPANNSIVGNGCTEVVKCEEPKYPLLYAVLIKCKVGMYSAAVEYQWSSFTAVDAARNLRLKSLPVKDFDGSQILTTKRLYKLNFQCKELQEMESFFFLYVSPEEVASSLNVALEV